MPNISWTDAARPGLSWLKRNLPTIIFRHFYAKEDLEDDVKVFYDSEGAPKVCLPKPLQVPSLMFSVSVLNTCPYLDVRLSAFHCILSAGSGEKPMDPFATFDSWRGPDLPRGLIIPVNINFLLNEYQLQIVQKWLRGEAWISAAAVVWVESKIGPAHITRVFRLAKPSVR